MTPLYKLLGTFLKFVYDFIPKIIPNEPEHISYFAISIIVVTLIIKLALLPINISNIKNQKKVAKLQPELDKLKQKYKNDPNTFAMKQQELYKSVNYNMMAGCLPLIIQLITTIALYRVFLFPERFAFTEPGFFDAMQRNFFYIKDLDVVDKTMILPILASLTTYISTKVMQVNTPAQNQNEGQSQVQSMTSSMTYIGPVMILLMGRRIASGLIFYWTLNNLFSILQSLITNKIVKEELEETSQ